MNSILFVHSVATKKKKGPEAAFSSHDAHYQFKWRSLKNMKSWLYGFANLITIVMSWLYKKIRNGLQRLLCIHDNQVCIVFYHKTSKTDGSHRVATDISILIMVISIFRVSYWIHIWIYLEEMWVYAKKQF